MTKNLGLDVTWEDSICSILLVPIKVILLVFFLLMLDVFCYHGFVEVCSKASYSSNLF